MYEDCPCTSSPDQGGGERVAAELANHAVSVGHQVILIAACPVDSAHLRDALHPDVEVCYVSPTQDSRMGRYLLLLPWLWRHRYWLMQQDIIHCHLTYAAVFGTLLHIWRSMTGAQGPMVVETYHSVGAPISPWRRWFFARMAVQRDALALIADDEYWRKFSLSHPKLITRVILNGVSIPSRNPVDVVEKLAYRRKIGIPDECRFVVGAVGRLGADRTPWMYLPIFAEIAREFGPDIHFLLAGGGAELDRMRALVIEQGLQGRVHLPGMVIEPTLPLAVMDLYISINVGAITGLAGMEAALSGVPVVAIQWVDGYRADANNWIWSSSDLSEVAKHASKLLHSSTDRQSLAARQKAYVESHHTVEAMANSYYALYQAAIAR